MWHHHKHDDVDMDDWLDVSESSFTVQSVGRLQEANNNANHKNMCIYMHVYPGNVLLLPRKFRKMSSIICNVISIENLTKNLKCHLIFGIMYMFACTNSNFKPTSCCNFLLFLDEFTCRIVLLLDWYSAQNT